MKQLVGIIFLLFASLTSSAQQYYFKQYSTQQGLPQSQVLGMLEDSKGSLWIATNGGGLSRLDGDTFTTLTRKDGLLKNNISALAKDSEGNLWLAYLKDSVTKYDGLNFTHYSDEEGQFTNPNTFVFAILEDKHKNIWVMAATQQNKTILFLKKGNKFINYSKRDTLVSSNLTPIIFSLDKEKNLVVNNKKGIYFFNGERFERKKIIKPKGFADKNLIFLYQDSKKTNWYVAIDNKNPMQFYQYDNKQGLKLFSFPSTIVLPNRTFATIVEDKKGNYWFLIASAGIVKYNPQSKKFTLYNQENGLPVNPNNIRNILCDRENNLWMSTSGSGIIKFLDGNFINILEKDGLPQKFVRSLYEDSQGNSWIGTFNNGLCKYDGSKIHRFSITETRRTGAIWTFFEEKDKKQSLLVGTANSLRRLDIEKNTYQIVNQEFSLPKGIGVGSIFEEGDKIWFGTRGAGVFCYDTATKKQIKTLTVNEGLSSNFIFDIKKDTKGNLWIATTSGLNKFDGEKITNFKNIPLVADAFILDIAIDKNDNVWLVDYNTGLHLFNGKTTTLYDQTDGLAANLVYSVATDKEGDIWVGTQVGLSEMVIDKNSQVVKIKNFNRSDGLLGDEMNGGSLIVDTKNSVWVGHINGLSKYTPTSDDSAKAKINSPITRISKVTPYLKDINWKDSLNWHYYDTLSRWNQLPQNLILPYNKNSLSFQFTSSSHTIPKKVRYQWRLDPLDKFWVSVTEKTEADYTNLPAGNYTFQVRSTNHLNTWGEATTYSFKIKPPVWQTWWFITLILTALSALIFLAVWARLRVVEAQKRELEHLITVRTKEVVKQKDQILGKNVELQEQKDQILDKNVELQEQKGEILEKNAELEQQQEEIMAQNEEVEQQSTQLSLINQKISEKNRNITASINYAKRIQDAMLPLQSHIRKALPESFIFYQPRDIVSGDFYWFYQKEEHIIIAAADCTGHGVPGAFMSLVASNLMHNIIVNKGVREPDKILNLLHSATLSYLKQKETHNQDGMDIALCHIDKKTRTLSFAGAKNPLVYVKNEEMTVIKGTRSSIGGFSKKRGASISFEKHIIKLEEEPTTFYLYTDGFQDQFGGEKGGKFRTVPFRDLLGKASNEEAMNKQKKMILESFYDWKGKEKQIDDVLVMGFRI